MSERALICDTGAMLDFLVASSPDHEFFRTAIEAASARFIPGLVLAELDYFLRDHRTAMRSLVDDIDRGAFVYVPPTSDQLGRAMVIDSHYADLQLGLVDATVVALAEELDIVRLATRDIADFSGVRLGDGRPFELITIPETARKARRRRRKR